jgi:hypothetical protein
LETARSTHGISFPTASTSAFVAKLILFSHHQTKFHFQWRF